MMDTPVHVLHLEDDRLDAELVQTRLAEHDLDCRITRVQTRDEFEAALRGGGVDVILVDYRLPGYDGMSALRQTLEWCPDVPFIFVSGVMGEEAAIEALTQGATDYVLKQNLSRLGPAVRRALSEARNRRERRRQSMINAAQLRLMQFATTHGLDELLEEAINEAEKETNSQIGFYASIDDNQQSLTLQNWSTRTKTQFCKVRDRGRHYPIAGAGVWVDCFHGRRPVIHNDYLSLAHRKGLPQGHAELIRELVVPVIRGDDVKAILGVGNKPSDYTQTDVEAMSLLADLVWEITERKQVQQRVALLSFALNGVHEAAFMVDQKACFQYVNDEACRLLGYTGEELLRMGPADVNPDRSRERWSAHWSDLKARGTLTFEAQLKTRDGRLVTVEINANYFEYDGQGYDLNLVRDITERKAVERERLSNLQFFENMDKVNRAIQGESDLEQMMGRVLDVVIEVFDCDKTQLSYPCNPEADAWSVQMERTKPGCRSLAPLITDIPMTTEMAEMHRMSRTTGKPIVFGAGTDLALTPEQVAWGDRSGMRMAIYPKKTDAWGFSLVQCSHPRIWTQTEIRLFEAIGRRLTDSLTSVLSYRDLYKNEKFLHNVVEQIPNMIFVKNANDLKFVRFNKAGERLLGYTREELLGRTDYDFFPKEEADFFTQKDRQVLDSKELMEIPEETIRTRTNEERILRTKKIPILDERGVPQYLLGISEDITEHKQAVASIRKLSQVVEQSPVSILITDTCGKIEFVNATFTQITGYTAAEAIGRNPRILKSGETPANEYQRLWKTISSGGVWQGEFHNRKKNGELFWEQATIAPVRGDNDVITHYVAVKEDITERKKLEEQLRHIQKMEAIGQLAGGIAHDFNNILSAITGYTELSISVLDAEAQVVNYLSQVMEASKRAKDLINQIMIFSRETEGELKPIRVSLPVKEALKLIRASIPASIEIRSDIQTQASAVADPTQIHQIVMNLCTNAAHAMQAKGGLLEVQLTDLTIDHEDDRKNYPDAKPGDYIRLTVTDQGYGIDAHYIHRIFDPFFTTKVMGEGTGMGLSVVHGIVKSYGGYIYVSSRLKEGSRFDILIPSHECVAPSEAILDMPIPTGSESILFVDDENMIVDVVKRMLETLGYQVVARTTAAEALEEFKKNPDRFDLVITDMAMPRMSGLDLAEKIFQIKPGFPIVLCTGFNAKASEIKIAEYSLRDIIYKPILRRDMAAVVRNVLDRRGSMDGDTQPED